MQNNHQNLKDLVSRFFDNKIDQSTLNNLQTALKKNYD